MDFVNKLWKISDMMKQISLEEPKQLCTAEYLSIWSINGYEYLRENWNGGRSCGILVFDSSQLGSYYCRHEQAPPHGTGLHLGAIKGGVEANEDPIASAVRELYEEAGYTAKESDLINLGTIRPTKNTDSVSYLYAWDAKGQTPVTPPGDGSKWEADAYCVWVDEKEAMWSNDPWLGVMISRVKDNIYEGPVGKQK